MIRLSAYCLCGRNLVVVKIRSAIKDFVASIRKKISRKK
jgi:hypothetical protein